MRRCAVSRPGKWLPTDRLRCWRAAPGLPALWVVFRDGSLAPGFAFGGTGAQRALLEAEGVTFLPDGRVDMARHQWTGEDETL